jgi:hypothetical protein
LFGLSERIRPSLCGQHMLIDARMHWAFGPVYKSRTWSPSHVRGLNRPVEAVVGTQLSGPKQQTHAIDQTVIFCTKVSPPLLRGHHSEGRLGLAAPEIALSSDGLSKLANYCCSVDGTRSGCRKKQIISSVRLRPRDFLSRSCSLKKVLTVRLPNRLLKPGSHVPPLSTFPSNINNDLDI